MNALYGYLEAQERAHEAKVIATERRIRDLTHAVDDLTDCAKSGIQLNTLKASRQELIEAHRKLSDLLEDTK